MRAIRYLSIAAAAACMQAICSLGIATAATGGGDNTGGNFAASDVAIWRVQLGVYNHVFAAAFAV